MATADKQVRVSWQSSVGAAAVLPLLLFFLVACSSSCNRSADDDSDDFPELWISPGSSWSNERWKSIVSVDGERLRLVLDYDPELNGPQNPEFIQDGLVPWPRALERPTKLRESSRIQRPAIALFASPDEPWRKLIDRRPGDAISRCWPRLYLGGYVAERRNDAIPLMVGLPLEMLVMDSALTIDDLLPEGPERGLPEIRVVRDRGRTKCTWGRLTKGAERIERVIHGSATTDVTQLEGTEARDAFPELALYLRRSMKDENTKVYALLEVSQEVTFLEVLRIVECANANPDIKFIPFPWTVSEEADLPTPMSSQDEELLMDDLSLAPRIIVNVLPGGKVLVRGKKYDVVENAFLPEGTSKVLLRALKSARWETCASVVKHCAERGISLSITFAPEAPGLPFERVLESLPILVNGGHENKTLTVDIADPPRWLSEHDGRVSDVEGRLIRVFAAKGSVAGDVLPVILRLKRLGARGFVF